MISQTQPGLVLSSSNKRAPAQLIVLDHGMSLGSRAHIVGPLLVPVLFGTGRLCLETEEAH